MKFITY